MGRYLDVYTFHSQFINLYEESQRSVASGFWYFGTRSPYLQSLYVSFFFLDVCPVEQNAVSRLFGSAGKRQSRRGSVSQDQGLQGLLDVRSDLCLSSPEESHETEPFLFHSQSIAIRSYITGLHDYLLSFLSRTKPLLEVSDQEAEAEARFAALWEEGKFEGWEEEEKPKVEGGVSEGGAKNEAEGIWCPACTCFLRYILPPSFPFLPPPTLWLGSLSSTHRVSLR